MPDAIKWLDEPEDHDYDAAEDYLSLLVPPTLAARTADVLQDGDPCVRKAKDILRASRLRALPRNNRHVAKNLDKIRADHPLSPVLLVRTSHGLEIADGYHRVCAVYLFDEDADIPCRLVSLPS
jgi:hypothetical protein